MKKTIISVAALFLLAGCGDKNMEAENATFCETEKVKTSKNIVGNDSAVSFVCINGQKYVKHYQPRWASPKSALAEYRAE